MNKEEFEKMLCEILEENMDALIKQINPSLESLIGTTINKIMDTNQECLDIVSKALTNAIKTLQKDYLREKNFVQNIIFNNGFVTRANYESYCKQWDEANSKLYEKENK